jgi:hypothetical protein
LKKNNHRSLSRTFSPLRSAGAASPLPQPISPLGDVAARCFEEANALAREAQHQARKLPPSPVKAPSPGGGRRAAA